MSGKTTEVTARVHKDMPLCCRASVRDFATRDRYLGGGEPGDQIRCACGNWLVFNGRGWRVK